MIGGMRETEPNFTEIGPFQFETQCRGGPARVAGPTLKVHVRDMAGWKLVMRFDCTLEAPHWHEVFKNGPEKIMAWRDTDTREAVELSAAELTCGFAAKLDKLGWREEAKAARTPEIERTVERLCGTLRDYLHE